MDTRRRDVVAVSLAACGFGCISVLAKLAYESGSRPAPLLTARLTVAALVLTPLLLPAVLRRMRSLAWGPARRGGLGGLSFAAAGFLEFEGLSRLPAPALVVLLFLAPVWDAIASRIVWGRRLGGTSAALLGLVVLGIALLVGSPGGEGFDPTGVAVAVAASFLYAGMFILIEDLVSQVGPLLSIGLIVWAGAVAACLVEPAGVADELSSPATRWHSVAVGVVTAASLLLLAGGLRTTPAFAASVITGAEPLAASALSWLLLGELLTAIQMAGGLAAVAGVVGISVRSVRSPDVTPG